MLKRLFEQNDTTSPNLSSIQFLTFKLGSDEYGIDIQNVQELRGYNTVTPVANASDYIKGVINLRGVIVPIIDLRIKLKLVAATNDQFTALMVLVIGGRVIGVIVDSISTLVTVVPEEIELSRRCKTKASLLGMSADVGLVVNRTIHLIDIDALYSSIDFGSIARLVTRAETAGDKQSLPARSRILGSRYLWAARVGERSQVSALKFRPHWRPVPK